MSVNLPIRRAVRSANSLRTTQPSSYLLTQRRDASNIAKWLFGNRYGSGKEMKGPATPQNIFSDKYLTKKIQPPTPKGGSLGTSSIFEDEEAGGKKLEGEAYENSLQKVLPRDPTTMRPALDPFPESRIRWERKMAIREVRKRFRETRAQKIKRSEREVTSKSHAFQTSVKKLVPLAKQITGKTVEDAIIQMRFSVKKAAKDVKEHLEHAKNEAIVRRGMALGKVEGKEFTPRHIQTKDKKTVRVDDDTRLYIEQAWVGRHEYGKSIDYRARGKAHMMKNPTTSLTVVLKEEKTRIREHDDRQKKIANRKTWVQLPNRPITAQRQYYSW